MRGHTAVAFPLRDFQITVDYQDLSQPLSIDSTEPQLAQIFEKVLHTAMALQKRPLSPLRGRLHISNTIPLGVGLGFSAALCLHVAHFLAHHGWVDDIPYFAHRLENHFHHISSGVDVYCIYHEQPLIYVKNQPIHTFQTRWQPCLALSDTGIMTRSKESVAAITEKHQLTPHEMDKIDESMSSAARLAVAALTFNMTHPQALEHLTHAIERSQACFQSWQPTPEPCQRHQITLLNHGALAVKFTGSGNGGMMLSLWPDQQALQRMISQADFRMFQVKC